MSKRIIRSRSGSIPLGDCLLSILALETLCPSKEIFVTSPWVNDIEFQSCNLASLIDLFPNCSSDRLHLSDILNMWAWQGSIVHVMCKDGVSKNTELLQRLLPEIARRRLVNQHEKLLVTSKFCISGSMNFTNQGLHVNGEKVDFCTDAHEVAEAMLSAKMRWEEAVAI